MADLSWNGDKIAKAVEQAKDMASKKAASLIADESIEKTPIETGTLRASAYVTFDGKGTSAVSYNTKYAARQHEEIGWAHPGGGEAKFLEKAMIQNQGKVRDLIAEEIRKAIQ